MALSPNVVTVAPGELITAQHLNNVRANLDRLDTDKMSAAGGIFTDIVYVGANPDSAVPTAGIMLTTNGFIETVVPASHATTAPNMAVGRGGSPGGNTGAQYIRFDRGAAAIGAITIASATTVAYGTSSDRRIKTFTRPVDPAEAVQTLAAVEPVNFYFTDHPEDGERTGFFAQDLHTIIPEAVTEGSGEPGDEGFVPWMVDLSKLVPTLVAAVQALTARIEQLEGAQP